MAKKNSKTRKKIIEAAQKVGFDTAKYIGQTKDNSNIYIACYATLHYCGLPLFIKAKGGEVHCVNFKGKEFDECFELLGKHEE